MVRSTSSLVTPAVTYTGYANFTFTGTVQNWTVPAKLKEVNVTLVGAAGKGTIYPGGTPVAGGNGAGFTTPMAVTGNTTIYVFVGGTDGWDGGGAGGNSSVPGTNFSDQYGGNGGGASLLCTGSTSCNATQSTVLVVAGGGGGAGGSTARHTSSGGAGGAGGSGGAPLPAAPAPASGSTAASAGEGNPGNGGGGATIAAGGLGGAATGSGNAGQPGGKLYGGAGGNGVFGTTCNSADGGGGGGGGGYFGGGGGSSGGNGCDAGGGGGGGSSFLLASALPAGGTVGAVTTTNTANGSISIEFVAVDSVQAGAITPGTPVMDSGQRIALAAHATSGAGSLSYSWYNNTTSTHAVPCANGTLLGTTTGPSFTTPVLTSNTSICYVAYDRLGVNASSAWDSIIVNPALKANPVTPASPVFDSGQNASLSSNAAGGTPNLSFQWFSSTTGTGACSTGTTITGAIGTAYLSTATGYYCYAVTDSSSAGPVTAGSSWDLVTVNGLPSAGPVSPISPAIDSGQSINLSSNATGGTPSLSFHWFTSSSGTGACTSGSAANSTVNVTVSPARNASYCYEVVDSSPAGSMNASSNWDNITVNPALVADPISPVQPNITAGSPVTLTAHPAGGTPSYSYLWFSGNSATCAQDTAIGSAISSTLTSSPANSTYYCYSVGDTSQGFPRALVYSSTDLVRVTTPIAPLKITSFTASPNPVNANATTTLTTQATGGVAPYSYAYTGLPAGCTTSNTSSLACTPTIGGNFSVTVTVHDAQGKSISDQLTLTVIAKSAGTSPIISSFTGSPSSFTLGNSTSLAVLVTGGTPPYSFVYSNLPPGCLTSDTSKLSCTPTSPGTYTISVNVTDSAHKWTQATTSINVIGTTGPLSATLTSNLSSVSLGASLQVTGAVHGGKGPFNYVWAINKVNSTSQHNLSWVFTPTQPGTYVLVLWVKDSAGHLAQSNSITIQVSSGSPATSSSSLGSWWWLIALIVIAVLALVLYAAYGRRRRTSSDSNVGEAAAGGSLVAATAETGGAASTEAKTPAAEVPEWVEDSPDDAPAEETGSPEAPASTPSEESSPSSDSEESEAPVDSEDGASPPEASEPANESYSEDDSEPAAQEPTSEDPPEDNSGGTEGSTPPP